MKTIPQILGENATRWPGREAIVAPGRSISFAGLEEESRRYAARLAGRGIRRGDPVLVFVPMSVELYVVLLGLFRVGAIAVFLDPSAGIRHIDGCCAHVPPEGLVSAWPLRLARPFVKGLRRIPLVLPLPARDLPRDDFPCPEPSAAPEDPALITFTSGSTGHPKAAVRTHGFLIAQHAALASSIGLKEGERDLTTLPVFVLANLASGITSILPDAKISKPGSVDAARVAAQIGRLRPGRTGGSPAFYARLLAVPGALEGFEKIYTGGAPVFPGFLENLQNAAPRAEVVAVYGSTEAEPISHISCREIRPEDWEGMRGGRGLLAGKPVPEIRLRVLPDQWGGPISDFREVGPDEIGEILVAGDHVLKGYLGGRGDGETKVRIGDEIWHRTGDAGSLDQDGRLWLAGRCSARIDDGSGTLYPFAVECVAMCFPEISRAAFISHRGKRILIVEHAPSAHPDLGEIAAACSRAGVDEVRPMARIPVDKRHNAKIDYPALKRRLGF